MSIVFEKIPAITNKLEIEYHIRDYKNISSNIIKRYINISFDELKENNFVIDSIIYNDIGIKELANLLIDKNINLSDLSNYDPILDEFSDDNIIGYINIKNNINYQPYIKHIIYFVYDEKGNKYKLNLSNYNSYNEY